MTVDEAFERCTRQALGHSALLPAGSWLLPRDMRTDIRTICAFARTARSFTDATLPTLAAPERIELLDHCERRLDLCIEGKAEGPLFSALRHAIERHDLPVQLFRDLLDAFRQDATKDRYASFNEVLDYCRRGANPLGRLVLHVSGCRDHEHHRLSDRICTALQLAGFWQDVGADIERDRIHLPLDEMERFAVTVEQLKERRFDEGLRKLMELQVLRAQGFLDEGRKLAGMLRNGLRLECKWIWLAGAETLRKIARLGHDTLRRRPALSHWDFARLLARAALSRW